MIDLSALTAPWLHPVLEGLAYLSAGLLYRRLRRRRGDAIDADARLAVIVAAILGAAAGSKLLHHLAAPAEFAAQLDEHGWGGIAPYLMGGKTIVGALLGGWGAVEWVKRRAGIRRRTGDLFALPLTLGIAIGRLGCAFAGPLDDTLGVHTDSVLGVDFGDGARWPTPLLEILFLVGLAVLLVRRERALVAGRPWRLFAREGDGFRLFLLAYLGWRLAVDFLKPYEVVGGLRIIQWACLVGAIVLLRDLLGAGRRAKSYADPG